VSLAGTEGAVPGGEAARRGRPALESTARALELCAPGDYTDWALSRLDRAQCLAWTDPDTGLGYAAETIAALTGPQRRGIIADRARGLLGALSPAQLMPPLAHEFAELADAQEEDHS
jgi:hypothetical protein